MNITKRNAALSAALSAAWLATAVTAGYALLWLRLKQWQSAAYTLIVDRATTNGPTVVSCGTCVHSRAGVSEDGEGVMQCHHSPPAMTISDDGHSYVAFPRVDSSDSCSQWQPSADPERRDLDE